MAEPNTSSISITVLFIGLLGPVAGQYALIVMAALAGALWPLSIMQGSTRRQGAWFLLRIVGTAVFLSGTFSWWLSTRFSWPVYEIMAAVSFVIGAMGNGWGGIFRSIKNAVPSAINKVSGSANDDAGA